MTNDPMRRCCRAAAALLVTMTLAWSVGAGAASEPDSGSEPAALAQARDAIANGDYAGAVRALEAVVRDSPRDADALNLMGYSLRKSGDRASAMEHYLRALAAEPKHRGANEYLGELYLEMDELAKAEERLEVLDRACFFGCKEYDELKQAILEYRQRKGLD